MSNRIIPETNRTTSDNGGGSHVLTIRPGEHVVVYGHEPPGGFAEGWSGTVLAVDSIGLRLDAHEMLFPNGWDEDGAVRQIPWTSISSIEISAAERAE